MIQVKRGIDTSNRGTFSYTAATELKIAPIFLGLYTPPQIPLLWYKSGDITGERCARVRKTRTHIDTGDRESRPRDWFPTRPSVGILNARQLSVVRAARSVIPIV